MQISSSVFVIGYSTRVAFVAPEDILFRSTLLVSFNNMSFSVTNNIQLFKYTIGIIGITGNRQKSNKSLKKV